MIECWLYWNLQYHGHRHIIIEQTLCNLMGLHCGSLADNVTGYWHLHPHFGMPRLDTYCSLIKQYALSWYEMAHQSQCRQNFIRINHKLYLVGWWLKVHCNLLGINMQIFRITKVTCDFQLSNCWFSNNLAKP